METIPGLFKAFVCGISERPKAGTRPIFLLLLFRLISFLVCVVPCDVPLVSKWKTLIRFRCKSSGLAWRSECFLWGLFFFFYLRPDGQYIHLFIDNASRKLGRASAREYTQQLGKKKKKKEENGKKAALYALPWRRFGAVPDSSTLESFDIFFVAVAFFPPGSRRRRERNQRTWKIKACMYNTRRADERIIYDDGSLSVHQPRICHRAHRSPASVSIPSIRPFSNLLLLLLLLLLFHRLFSFHFTIYSSGRVSCVNLILLICFLPPHTCIMCGMRLDQIISSRNDWTTRQHPFTCRNESAKSRQRPVDLNSLRSDRLNAPWWIYLTRALRNDLRALWSAFLFLFIYSQYVYIGYIGDGWR